MHYIMYSSKSPQLHIDRPVKSLYKAVQNPFQWIKLYMRFECFHCWIIVWKPLHKNAETSKRRLSDLCQLGKKVKYEEWQVASHCVTVTFSCWLGMRRFPRLHPSNHTQHLWINWHTGKDWLPFWLVDYFGTRLIIQVSVVSRGGAKGCSKSVLGVEPYGATLQFDYW